MSTMTLINRALVDFSANRRNRARHVAGFQAARFGVALAERQRLFELAAGSYIVHRIAYRIVR